MKQNSKNEIDLIQQLGSLAFASRLRRLSERLLRDVSSVYQTENMDFEARWFPVFYLLWRQSPLAVTVIAQRLHLTHPAVNQVAGAMEKAGLLSSTRDAEDDRRRLLSLSAGGKILAKKLQPIWQDIQEATSEVLTLSGADFLAAIARIEEALDKTSMHERVLACRKAREFAAIQIVDYQPRYRSDFRRLNLEWIEKYFAVEPADKAIMDDPQNQVIAKGGKILFAKIGKTIIGTAALIRHDDKTFELAKMAVDEKAQGHQAGKRLALAAIEQASALNARRIVLFTNSKLIAANALYRKLGFVRMEASLRQVCPYQRPSIGLELDLRKLSQQSHRSKRK